MKNIFKTILKSTFICLALFLSGCEAEKDLMKDDKITLRKFSMREMAKKADPKLIAAMAKVKNLRPSNNENAKVVFYENAGLYIDDEKGLYIEKDGVKSYTFPVIRTSSNDQVENICLKQNPDGNYDAFLVRYDYTKEQADALSPEQLKTREKQFITLLKDGQNVEMFHYVCVDVVIYVSTDITAPIDEGELTGNNGNTFGTTTTVVTLASDCFFTSDEPTAGSIFNNGFGENSPGNGPIITGSIIDQTVASDQNEMPLGWAISYFERNLDSFQQKVYDAHPELRAYLSSHNCDEASRQFVIEMIAAFDNTEYTQEQKDTLTQLIYVASQYRVTCAVDDTVTGNPSTVQDLADYLSDNLSEDNNQLDNEDLPSQHTGFIGRCKIRINGLSNIRVAMNFSTNANGQYTLTKENVTSELSGFSAFTSWTQLSNQCIVNNNSNGRIRVDLYGKLEQHYTIPPLQGIKITQFIRIILIIDKNTGEVISSEKYFD